MAFPKKTITGQIYLHQYSNLKDPSYFIGDCEDVNCWDLNKILVPVLKECGYRRMKNGGTIEEREVVGEARRLIENMFTEICPEIIDALNNTVIKFAGDYYREYISRRVERKLHELVKQHYSEYIINVNTSIDDKNNILYIEVDYRYDESNLQDVFDYMINEIDHYIKLCNKTFMLGIYYDESIWNKFNRKLFAIVKGYVESHKRAFDGFFG